MSGHKPRHRIGAPGRYRVDLRQGGPGLALSDCLGRGAPRPRCGPGASGGRTQFQPTLWNGLAHARGCRGSRGRVKPFLGRSIEHDTITRPLIGYGNAARAQGHVADVMGTVASRPEEFHLRPLTERCGSLSAHTAPTKQPTASLPPRSPPVASRTLTTPAWPNPFAPAALPAFLARTGWSVPVLRLGTLASWWSPLGLLPWHRSDRFPQFHMRARIRLAPPIRRSPSAPYPGIRRTDPRGSRSLWF